MELTKMTNLRGKLSWPMIIWMIIAHSLAVAGLFYMNIPNLIVFLVLYFITGCLGICIGYHRLLTHRSFQTTKWLRRFFATCGTLALQGGPSDWVGDHRLHHVASDTEADPHNAKQGFWHSHMGWIFFRYPEKVKKSVRKLCRDIQVDPYLRFLDSAFAQIGLQVAVGLVVLAFFGWGGVLCGVFLRLVTLYHATWFVNSLCHLKGYTSFKTKTLAKNNWFVALLAWGEGWHNNHHADEHRVRAGLNWWEFDASYIVIRLLSFLGLTWGLKR